MERVAVSSGLKTADAAIKASAGKLHGVELIAAAADCSVVLYDNATAGSGTVIGKVVIDVSAEGGPISKPGAVNCPVAFSNGCYADVTGTGANYIVYYE